MQPLSPHPSQNRACAIYAHPAQRHQGEDINILAKREAVYRQAKSKNPTRWSGEIRNWEPVKEIYPNPEKQKIVFKESKAA